MKKNFTKRGNLRKGITIGAVFFLFSALVATGSATFVITARTAKEAKGGVSIGGIKNQSIEIRINDLDEKTGLLPLDKYSFKFQAKAGDESGRIHWDGKNSESLSITITGDYSPANYVNGLTYRLDILDENGNVSKDGGDRFNEAAKKNYLVLPDCFGKEVNVDGIAPVSGEENKNSFTIPIAFGWGSAFKNMNPGNYFDEDADGMKVKSEEVQRILMDFYSTLTGKTITAEDVQAGKSEDTDIRYRVTIATSD